VAQGPQLQPLGDDREQSSRGSGRRRKDLQFDRLGRA
jgi:hypothetical protein